MTFSSNKIHNKSSIQVNFQEGRENGKNTWDLPDFGHPLSMCVFPLFAEVNSESDPHLFPVGSSFCLNSLGILATAEHNIRESLKYHWDGINLRQRNQLPESYELKDMGLAIFHHSKKAENSFSANIWPIESLNGAPPTDVIYGFPKFQTTVPRLSFPVSFTVPRIGSKITCFGYTDSSFGEEGLSLKELINGEIKWADKYSHRFRAVEGRVTRIFTQRFANGFICGPCISIDEEVFHGMSGGPAFNEQGQICGIVSAGATNFFNSPASIVSLLYPTLLTKIKFGGNFGKLRIAGERTLLGLATQGLIKTNGSEKMFEFKKDGDSHIVCPLINSDDCSFVHDDFNGYQSGIQAERET
jgi:hypothetical protein